MKTSESIKEIAGALSRVQGELKPIGKSGRNHAQMEIVEMEQLATTLVRVMEIVEMEQLATTLVRLFTDKELDAAVKEVDPCNTCEHRDSLQDDHGGCVEEQDCSELSGLTPAEMEAVLAARIEGRRP